MNRSFEDDRAAEKTSLFRSLGEDHPPVPDVGASDVVGVEGLPSRFGLIVVRRGPNAGARFLLDQAVSSAGRHPESDVFLDDASVSRRHAEFRHDGENFLLVDVGSLNGTYLNHVPIDAAVLADGDEIQIGKFRLVFRGSTTRNEPQ